MSLTQKLLDSILGTEEAFSQTLKEIIKKDLGITSADFSVKCGISKSTLYKILQGDRGISLATIRKIIFTIRELEGLSTGRFIALIAAHPVLNKISERSMVVDGTCIRVREYPALSVEEAIIAAVRAERDGACALVCAPIVVSTIQKIVRVPITTIIPQESVNIAIRNAAKKIGMNQENAI